uniref:Uncharacterized protein n=1 Tax=Rhizophora mucronata TaxID=61149 RepID=A0A2P2NTI8_RHIMU
MITLLLADDNKLFKKYLGGEIPFWLK